ncbi:MAG: L,D-transpeptidase family protein [Nanoarchaeota archaeon]|nr:L,D-transpeptidase family protein [Nanoarchaeota archaeon]
MKIFPLGGALLISCSSYIYSVEYVEVGDQTPDKVVTLEKTFENKVREESEDISDELDHDRLEIVTRGNGQEVERFYNSSIPLQSLLDDCRGKHNITIDKSERRLGLYCETKLLKEYGISLGFAPEGDKEYEGDGKTPEGEYFITTAFPSRFHKSLQISYPNLKHAERGLSSELITQREYNVIVQAIKGCKSPPQNTKLGSFIQIHGRGGGVGVSDWTLGCIALENKAIDEVYSFLILGCDKEGNPKTKITIVP